MKTLKKLFSVSAIVALLGTLAPMYAFAAGNSLDLDPEFPEAYAYAYKYGVTTQSTDNVDMGGKLTRIAMAKMIAKYAKNVLNLEEAENAGACTFVDVTAALDAQYDNGVTEACKLGLMGQNMPENKFRPNDLVTRAEFGTTLSRALNRAAGTTIEEGTPYYEKHLKYLNEKGIMKVISDPNMLEVRGYVMLMMMRADESYEPSTAEGCTAEELLACTVAEDMDACIAACSGNENPEEPEVVKNGTLKITVDDYSSSLVSAPRQGTIKFNTIKLTASEPITLNTLTLSRIGLSYASDVKKVWFEKDGVRITSKASVSTDGIATVNFTKGLSIKSTEKIDLVAELDMNVGNEVAFKIDSVTSTAEKTDINATTTKYRATDYETAHVIYTETSVASSYKLGEQDEILFAKTTVENDAQDTSINVKSITFNSYNSDAENILKDVRLVKDGKDVSKSVTFDGKKLTVALDDTIESNKRAVYSLYAKTNSLDDDSETFNFVLDGSDGFVAYETTSNFRTTFDTTSTILGSTGNEVVINGGKVVFSNDSSFAQTVTAGQGYSDVQIANGTLTVAEPIMFNKLVIDENVTGSSIKSMALEIAGTRYNADINVDLTGVKTSYTFEDVYVNKTSSVKLYINLNNTAAGTITLSNINGTSITENGEYQNNGALLSSSDIAGTIKVAKVTVKNSTFTLTNDNSSTVTVVEGDSDPVTIFDGKITSSKQDISLSKVVIRNITGATALSNTNYVDLTLYVGNKTITKKCSEDGCGIEYPISNVKINGEGTSIKVVVEPTLTTGDYQFTVEAEGLDNNNNPATASAVNTAKLTVAESASLSISASSQGNKVILEGGNRELLTFTAYAQNGSIELTGVKFDITKITQAGDITVTLDGENLEGTKTLSASGTLEIADLAETLTKGSHTFVVKANVANITGDHTVTISGLTLNDSITSTVSPTYYVVKALPNMVVSESGTDNEITLSVSLPTTATTPIEIKGFGVTSGTIYINDQEETPTLINPVTLNPGDSMNVVLKVSAAGTAKITSISYDTVEATPESYTIENTYTNFPRGKFQVTFKS